MDLLMHGYIRADLLHLQQVQVAQLKHGDRVFRMKCNQSGWYAILAMAADDPKAEGDPGDFASEYFVKDVYNWVGDSKDQENTPTDLWASASGMGEVYYYRKVIVDQNNPDSDRRWRWVTLFHQHGVDGPRWQDYANEDDVQQ